MHKGIPLVGLKLAQRSARYNGHLGQVAMSNCPDEISSTGVLELALA